MRLEGALLIDKPPEISSYGVIDALKDRLRTLGLPRREFPKLGHGGTLDPFATGLLIVLIGRSVKLARYFLGAIKGYEGVIRFGETTVPGDPTAPISERSDILPESLDSLRIKASELIAKPYLQTPPMHSAKKHQGKPLYMLARAGIEVEREPKLCLLHHFEILSYEKPDASFDLICGSGTYVRTLAQDFGKMNTTVALLQSLKRTRSGFYSLNASWPLSRIIESITEPLDIATFPCFVPFDQLLNGHPHVEATEEEYRALQNGIQNTFFNILTRWRRMPSTPAVSEPQAGQPSLTCLAITHKEKLIAVARPEENTWSLERVFFDQAD